MVCEGINQVYLSSSFLWKHCSCSQASSLAHCQPSTVEMVSQAERRADELQVIRSLLLSLSQTSLKTGNYLLYRLIPYLGSPSHMTHDGDQLASYSFSLMVLNCSSLAWGCSSTIWTSRAFRATTEEAALAFSMATASL